MVIITTPNNRDVDSGKFCWDMKENAAKWTLDCFDFSNEELDNYIQSNGSNNFIYVEYSYKELGRDEEWLRQQIREMNNDLLTVKREILLEWPKTHEGSIFSEQDIEKMLPFIKEPLTYIYCVNKRFPVTFYEMPDFNLNYILSCDISGGLSQDNTTIAIIHPEDFHLVGMFKNNKIDTDTFKELLKELLTLYFKHSLLVVERNYCGLAILQSLMKDPMIEPRMYRENKEHLAEKKTNDGVVVKKKTKIVSYGVDTTQTSRAQMHDLLRQIVETEYEKIISKELLDEISDLEMRNGRIDHRVGGHDDLLMAYLIFRWAVYYGTCFKDKFGIYPTPSKLNVRVISSSENIKKIENIIVAANKTTFNSAALNSNPLYKDLVNKEMKLKEQLPDENKTNKMLDNFLKWNK